MTNGTLANPDLLYLNGIDGSTGEYFRPPIAPHEFGRHVKARAELPHPDQRAELVARLEKEKPTMGLRAGLDPLKLNEAGWAVVFPSAWEPKKVANIREALEPILTLRQAQAGEYYSELSGDAGYRKGERKKEFIERHDAILGPADPRYLPYYILLIGGPQDIPFSFEFELNISYAVGRLYFDRSEDYANYARSVVSVERSAVCRPRRAVICGPDHDPSTHMSSTDLLAPVYEDIKHWIEKGKLDFSIERYSTDRSRKDDMLRLLGGPDPSAFLFTASHGLAFPFGDSRQIGFQGALLMQDWPGPGQGGIKRDHFLAAEDIPAEADLAGLVSFHFACFGLGTPQWDEYSRIISGQPRQLAGMPFLSALPRRLLSHPKGGALGVIGHVDQAWSFSFRWDEARARATIFQSMLFALLSGKRLGQAMEAVHLAYAELAAILTGAQDPRTSIDVMKSSEAANVWTAHNDARAYSILGDPAVRLAVDWKDLSSATAGIIHLAGAASPESRSNAGDLLQEILSFQNEMKILAHRATDLAERAASLAESPAQPNACLQLQELRKQAENLKKTVS